MTTTYDNEHFLRNINNYERVTEETHFCLVLSFQLYGQYVTKNFNILRHFYNSNEGD